MSITEIKYKSGRVLRIIDGEYVIGAGGSCNNKVLCPKKVFNGYVVRRCGNSDEFDCSGGCIYDDEFYSNDNEIYLNDRNLNELDKCICCYKNLGILEANNNNLTTIPDCICNMENLLDLCLNNNQLTNLPECIGSLLYLETLELNNNNLTTIPDCICNMSYLNKLYLSNNQLTNLPECIGSLDKSWSRIYLENNNFTDEYKEHIKNDLFPIANSKGHLYL